MAIVFKAQFSGYCPYCDQSTLKDADFCHHCGQSLFVDSAHPSASTPSLNTNALSTLIKETTQVFLIWCCCISLLGGAALINHFYHSISPIIVGTVAFVYAQIFFSAKLDELSAAIQHSPRPIAFISLLLPILGTIFCYQHLTLLAQAKTREQDLA